MTPRTRLVLVMVGLPARGKTHIAHRLARYLRWMGHRTRVFNVGDYRRSLFGAAVPHSFFDPENPEGVAARRQAALAALDDVISWAGTGAAIPIYDATNSTRARRQLVRERFETAGLRVVFVESVCDLPEVIEANIRETKLGAPDYAETDPAEAVADFRARIAHYEAAYEPVDDDAASYVKILDVGRQVVANRMYGYLTARIVYFLMNLNVARKQIWLSRHGESEANAAGRIGTDASLTARGRAFAERLGAFVTERPIPAVWSSTLQRAMQTAEATGRPVRALKALDEIDAGTCDGWTYEEIAARLPEDFAARKADKLAYRYPRGESYLDVFRRLEPVLLELERRPEPVLIVAHQAVIRCLYGYLTDQPLDAIPHLAIPLHTVIGLEPRATGATERRHLLE